MATNAEIEARLDAQDERASAFEARLSKHEELVGRMPSVLGDDQGSGLAKHIVDLIRAVAGLKDSFDADRKERAAEKAAELEKAKLVVTKREPWSRAGWIAVAAGIGAAVSLAVVGGWHWISTLHH